MGQPGPADRVSQRTGEQWEYRHDASGRRTEKRCDRKKIRFTYLWDGDSIAEIREYRDDKLYSVRHLVFNGFELISQQFSRVRQPHPSVAPQWVTRTNHAVSDLTGRPLMLFNSEGKTVWRPGQTSLWGLALSLPADTDYPDPRGERDRKRTPACCMRDSGRMQNRGCAITGSGTTSRKPGCTW